jgi:DNA polymerase (family 10)
MECQAAYTLAARIVTTLQPMCERIEIAGSIRRGRPVVGDIDLVILPKPGQATAIRDRIRQRCQVITDGPQTFVAELPLRPGTSHPTPHIQIDVWFARPEILDLLSPTPTNWGTLLLCRTGSQGHNIRLCARATQRGLHWNPHLGVTRDGRVIASATEREVFAALDLPEIPPGFREGDVDWDEFRGEGRAASGERPEPAAPAVAAKFFAATRARLEATRAGAGAELERRLQ